ncbi:galactose-1-phosphate uridylyltransferase [Mycobacterium tuberculosis]|nr:galactose-1-phosphate uridylyltransferase [Mycobacterium tuberculosis]
MHAWRHRTAELTALPGVAQVFCFENRGEEIGVTLPTRTARFTPIRI